MSSVHRNRKERQPLLYFDLQLRINRQLYCTPTQEGKITAAVRGCATQNKSTSLQHTKNRKEKTTAAVLGCATPNKSPGLLYTETGKKDNCSCTWICNFQ